MSWLRNHMRHYVLPGIHTLARHGGKPLTAVDIKPRDKVIRPSQKCKHVEAGLLYALVSSVLKKDNPLREVALGLCRQIGRGNDAEFVYEVDSRGRVKQLGEHYEGVEGSDVLHSMLCNSMRRLKRKMRKKQALLLPGRDVWCWEVMARKLSVGSTYDPRVSRSVANSSLALKICINDWKIQNWDDVLFFDTGFAGSIPSSIGHAVGLKEINMLLLSANRNEKQIFRTHTGSRAKALAFEYLAKYQQRGTARAGAPYQELADLEEFIKAALFTIWLWHHVSPQRLPSYRDKKIPGYKKKATKFVADVNNNWNQDNWGTLNITGGSGLMWDTGTSTLTGNILQTATTADTAITFDSGWNTSSTDITTVGALQTLDQLWGAGTSGQLLLDKTDPPQHMIDELTAKMQKEVDKKVVQSLLKDAGGDTDKIPKDKIPPSMLYKSPASIMDTFEPVTTKKSQVKPYILNPETFTLHDPQTGVNVEVAEDVKAVLSGKQQPQKEGFGLGEYPGPPMVNEKMLKTMAGMKPEDPGVPEIDLAIKIESAPPGEKFGSVVKETTLTAPDGKKKTYKTPLTG